MNKTTVLALAGDLLTEHDREQDNLERIDGWLHGKPELPKLPRKASEEHKALLQMSKSPNLSLVVTTLAQTLDAERVYSEVTSEHELRKIWEPWQRNRMSKLQYALYWDTFGFGLAYTRVTPGDVGAVIRGRSPLECFAAYRDPADDEFPEYVIEVRGKKDAKVRWVTLWDDEVAHHLSLEDGKFAYIEPRVHGVGVPPFVRYTNHLDLLGRTPGEIEPLIPIGKRLNKTDYDRLLTQHFNSWKVRTASGLDENVSDEEAQQRKLKLAQDDILTGGPGVEFGTLPETPLDGFIKAKESDLTTLAALSQTPITAFGELINLSADALVEARAALYAKRDERRASVGMSHLDTLRLCAHVEGREDHARDFTLQIGWADTEARTLNQAVDALGKAATMLGVPAQLLWELIPGVSHTTAEQWRNFAAENPSFSDRMAEVYVRQMGDGADA